MVFVAEVAGVDAHFAGLGRVTLGALPAGFVTLGPFLFLDCAHSPEGGAVVGRVIGLADWAEFGGHFYRGFGWGSGLLGLAGTGLVQARVVNCGKGHVSPVSPPISSVRLITVFCFSLPRFCYGESAYEWGYCRGDGRANGYVNVCDKVFVSASELLLQEAFELSAGQWLINVIFLGVIHVSGGFGSGLLGWTVFRRC